jgi:hypothetical protein
LSNAAQFYILKKLSETRWSCKVDATRVFSLGYDFIKDALADIAEADDEKSSILGRGLVQSYVNSGNRTVFRLLDILELFDTTSKIRSSTFIQQSLVPNSWALFSFSRKENVLMSMSTN